MVGIKGQHAIPGGVSGIETVDAVLVRAAELQGDTPGLGVTTSSETAGILQGVHTIQEEAQEEGLNRNEAEEVALTVVACIQAGLTYGDLMRRRREAATAELDLPKSTGSLVMGIYGVTKATTGRTTRRIA